MLSGNCWAASSGAKYFLFSDSLTTCTNQSEASAERSLYTGFALADGLAQIKGVVFHQEWSGVVGPLNGTNKCTDDSKAKSRARSFQKEDCINGRE